MFPSLASFLRVKELGMGARWDNGKLWSQSQAELDVGFAFFWVSGCVGCSSRLS